MYDCQMAAPIFLCYRSRDDAYAAALLDELLARELGPSAIFRAAKSVAPGDDYVEALSRALDAASVLLVVVGPNWVDSLVRPATDSQSESDWVRKEISTALTRGIRIIPILLSNTERLVESDLPADISALARRQYFRFDYRSLYADAGLIADELGRLISSTAPDEAS